MHELIIHPRTRTMFYKGDVVMEAYALAAQTVKCPLVFNGNIFSADDVTKLLNDFPSTAAIMMGRGLIANPALAQSLQGGETLSLEPLRSFLDHLFREYRERYQLHVALGRMRDVMKHTACCFEDPEKAVKMFRKASVEADYHAAMNLIFSHSMTASPAYDYRFW